MSPQFNSMNELTSYLDNMEKRVKMLEEQNDILKSNMTRATDDAANALPRTGLLSHGFLRRAFTVWGHYFVASLIIFLVVAVLMGALLLIPGLFTIFTNLIRGVPVP